MRINKYIASCGVASRRKAEEIILDGRVTVNGKVAKAGLEVKVGDVIEITFGNNTVKVQVESTAEVVRKENAQAMYKNL